MKSDELKEFKEEVRNAPKEYLLELKEYYEQEYRKELQEIGELNNKKYLLTYKILKTDYIDFLVEFSKKLDIINAELKRMEYMK